MKNTQRKKLSLDKIKVARLNHLNKIRGGSEETTNQDSNATNCITKQECDTFDCNVSTKTVPLVATVVCLG